MTKVMLDTQHGGSTAIRRTRSILRVSPSLDLPSTTNFLQNAPNKQLVPWPGMKFACNKILHLYCKVFGQMPLYELILRKTCSGCKCPRDSHAIYLEQLKNVGERLGFKSNSGHISGAIHNSIDPASLNFAWLPPGLNTISKVDEFFSEFPSEKVPRLGTPGERYRDKQMLAQLPKQDLALAYCKHVALEHHNSYEDFVSARNEIALDIGFVIEAPSRSAFDCHECQEIIKPNRLCVFSPRFGGFESLENSGANATGGEKLSLSTRVWHPACFRCKQCNEPLVDLAHCVHDGAIYCERHYAELLKPRCAACDEPG